ncbi:hypothetical protein KY289_007137 [Solanum tuberosum]|nr:hypothetical protein KY289_007137 [Solanum tuberosum]
MVQQFIQGLMNEGARVIGVAGVPPFGCLPIVITIDSGDALQPRRCIESYSAVAREYNSLLQRLLKTMEIHGTKLFYVDIYDPINDMIQNPIKYGFSEVTMGCCGSGLIEASILCNPKSIVCNNPSNHMFWDAVHPSQATYYTVFQAIHSTADPGNNNHILTPIKSNFKPYGREFPNHVSTGRFTNGKLIYDFIATHVGVKEYVPPYLDQSLSIEELKTGVSFASAGTGIDPLTAQLSNVISLSKQVEYFKEYQEKMEAAIGKEQTKKLIKEALFIISIGSNDFIANYKLYPFRSQNYRVSAYIDFLLQHVHNFLKELLDQGARKIAMAGLPPLGCLPSVITLNSNDTFSKRDCIDSFSSIARDYNPKLQNKLNGMQNSFANLGSRIVYLEAYKPFMDIIQYKKLYGEYMTNLDRLPLLSPIPLATLLCIWTTVLNLLTLAAVELA